ncbi:hypothetical protein VN97_g7108 [Penicillium thymicola]|uniref:Secreted protein n=1 Tax=Penicillium thymicola TaxID=293382 RepID=A0AAI9TFT9_PENTH|nr:hypothetical protein VN97_g7108 [Penicillium thymicola]
MAMLFFFFFFWVAIDFANLKPAASFDMPGKCSPGEMKWAAGAAMRANRYLISPRPNWPAKKKRKERRDFVTLHSMECEMIFFFFFQIRTESCD